MVHELLSPGVQGSDILYIATREESRGIKERGREKDRERESELVHEQHSKYHKLCG